MSKIADLVFERETAYRLPPWWAPQLTVSLTVGSRLRTMEQIIQDKQNERITAQYQRDTENHHRILQKRLRESPVFEISDVAAYVYGAAPDTVWNIEQDFPNLAPPYRSFWMEWQRPQQDDDTGAIPERLGVLVSAQDALEHWQDALRKMDDPANIRLGIDNLKGEVEINWKHHGAEIERILAEHEAADDVQGAYEALSPAQRRVLTQRRGLEVAEERWAAGDYAYFRNEASRQAALEGGRWRVEMELFGLFSNGKKDFVAGPFFALQFVVDEHGKFLRVDHGGFIVNDYGTRPPEDQAATFFTSLVPAMMAISFLHCKNVSVQENVAPEGLQKAREKRGRPPLVTYRTLELEPLKQVLRSVKGKGGGGVPLKLALHSKRGHFKEFGAAYGKGKLFGKHDGIYWWHDRLIGSAEDGVVEKDYKVKA